MLLSNLHNTLYVVHSAAGKHTQPVIDFVAQSQLYSVNVLLPIHRSIDVVHLGSYLSASLLVNHPHS